MTFSLNMETPRFRGRGIIEDVLEWKTFGGREMDEKSILSKSQLKEHRTALWFFFFSNFLHLSNFTKLVKYIAYLDLLSGVVLFESLRFFLISLEEKREYSLDWKTLYLYLHCTTCCLHSIWGSSSWFFRLSCKSIAISFELCLI